MIKIGEYIYIYNSQSSNFLVSYIPGKEIHSHKGKIILPENLNFGDTLTSTKGINYYILKPSLIELSMKVHRKNTIIYPKEAGRIILELGICEGTQIIEVGTGSGAFTIILSKIVGTKGHVFTYDISQKFSENAKKNVEKFGNINNVTFHIKNIYESSPFEKEVDAIFVDVPEPWKVVPNIVSNMKSGAKIGFISPNIEQVQKTYDILTKNGFVNIYTLEILERKIRVKKDMTRPLEKMIGHTGYIYFANKINQSNL